MGMTHDQCVLIAALSTINKQAATFALEFVDGDMPPERQLAFAHQLGQVALQLVEHARQQLRTIDGDVLDGDVVDADTATLTPAGRP